MRFTFDFQPPVKYELSNGGCTMVDLDGKELFYNPCSKTPTAEMFQLFEQAINEWCWKIVNEGWKP